MRLMHNIRFFLNLISVCRLLSENWELGRERNRKADEKRKIKEKTQKERKNVKRNINKTIPHNQKRQNSTYKA